MNYVRFYPHLCKNLRSRVEHNFEYDNQEELKKLLDIVENAENRVVKKEIFDKLAKLNNFNTGHFIQCYLKSENEVYKIVMLSPKFFEYINMKKIDETFFRKRSINRALESRKGYFLPKVSFRRLEYLFGCDFEKYILKNNISQQQYLSEKVFSKEEQEDIIYIVIRILSKKYNLGYKIDFKTRSFILENGEDEVEFYWNNEGIFQGKNNIAELLDNEMLIARKVKNIFNKRINKKLVSCINKKYGIIEVHLSSRVKLILITSFIKYKVII